MCPKKKGLTWNVLVADHRKKTVLSRKIFMVVLVLLLWSPLIAAAEYAGGISLVMCKAGAFCDNRFFDYAAGDADTTRAYKKPIPACRRDARLLLYQN